MSAERIALVAPGAIGGPLGGLLTRAGHDVTLIDQWPAHVAAMNERGLRITVGPLESPEADYTVPVCAHHVHEVCTLREPFDVVYVTCKSYDTRWLVQLIAPRLDRDGVVVSVQNSLNFDWIAPIVGAERTMSCVLTGGGELLEPGHVWRNRRFDHPYYSVGELDGRVTARAERVAGILSDAGAARIATDVRASLWTKLVHNSVSAALSGLVAERRRSWEMVAIPEYRGVSARLYREGIAVATAQGQPLESLFGIPAAELREASDDAIAGLIAATGGGASPGATSMVQQDLRRGRPTEVIGFFNGLLARKGRGAGVPTPMNDAMVALYERLERGELEQGLDNLALLTHGT